MTPSPNIHRLALKFNTGCALSGKETKVLYAISRKFFLKVLNRFFYSLTFEDIHIYLKRPADSF
jgi:hypothetical protein